MVPWSVSCGAASLPGYDVKGQLPMNAEPTDLTDEQVAAYRQVLVAHALDPELGVCRVCQVLRCEQWVDAFDKLALAKQLMTLPNWPRVT